ncbi:hypothetical protein SLE2022_300850 [Rubroshorea leprosula]
MPPHHPPALQDWGSCYKDPISWLPLPCVAASTRDFPCPQGRGRGTILAHQKSLVGIPALVVTIAIPR